MKEVKDFLKTKEEVRAARIQLEDATEKDLKDSRIAQIEAVKKARETILD
ncbi:hypothetical protein KAJ89_06035 [Candidatus Parcubacteria bacterium]|nr:hypothetical protein [Candidatus Parcubacteria bacterium]